MNATEKAKILKANGWKLKRTKRGDWAFQWYAPDGIRHGASDGYAAATNFAYNYCLHQQEALEADTQQSANDLAGEVAYSEVKAEGYMHPCENCGGSGVEINSAGYSVHCYDCDGTGIQQEDEDETTQLRQQLADARAENARLKAELDNINKMLDRIEIVESSTEKLKTVNSALEKLVQSQLAPKTPVPTRCRVNWNARGFSSGSYPVLGYSQEKQIYVLDISTDCNRAMPKSVRFTDCLEA
jgi:hypothetical protein